MIAVLSLLYDLCIAPLEIAYGTIYHVCARALGYGYGLLALSAVTTLLLVPLREKVAATQEEERRLRRVIDQQLVKIRAESSGEERHLRIRRLYRRYAYHPVMSIRAMWGLLLQMPFIFAAYHMLSGLSALRLVSFWGIPSLAAPDGLLPGGVNLLPLLMTAFNFAAALLTPGATRRETGQAFVIAALFLLLLYGAPSALLIYWTTNNFFSLIEVLHQRRRPAGLNTAGVVANDILEALPARASETRGSDIPGRWLAVYAFALASLPLVWGHCLRWRIEAMYSGAAPYYFRFSRLELFLAAALAVGAIAGVRRIMSRRGGGGRGSVWPRVGVILSAALAGFLVCGWAFAWQKRTVSGKLFIWTTLAYVAVAFLAWSMACAKLNGGLVRLFRREAERSGFMLYWPAAFAIAALVVLFAPMASFQSAPEVFDFSAVRVFRELLPYFICILYFFLYLRVALPRRIAARAGLLAAYLALACLVFALAFPPAGIVDGNVFQPENNASPWSALVQDAGASLLALGLLWALARLRSLRLAAFGLGVCAFALLAFGAYVAAFPPGPGEEANGAAEAEQARAAELALPPYHQRLFSLSPGQPNVLIFMFDMFHGGDIGRMLDEDPAMAARLPGFVWYRDTLSDANNTLLSFPSILGGPEYTPTGINAQPGGQLADKVLRSLAEMPRRFLQAGYAVSYFNVQRNLDIYGDKTLRDMLGYRGEELVDTPMTPVYTQMAREAISPGGGVEHGGNAAFLLSVSLFRAVPNLLREGLADLGLFDSDRTGDRLFRDIAIPLLMPGFLTADSPRPTFKTFATTLCHNPYVLGPDSLVPLQKSERLAVNKSGDAHYFTERHAIRLMEKLIAWLKANRVYDNTRLIFVSDHDHKDDPHPYLPALRALLPYHLKPHALLMVKDFNADGPLRASDRLMQGHDTPALACEGLPEEVAPPPPSGGPERVRRHYLGHSNIASHAKDHFTKLTPFTVRGSMFDASNWKQDGQE
ncbi:MAG: YidC/Oxa1 family membrane protein insertase [Planctomycetota bacterium]|jgi:hypothetical protein|nr:YidC/Oxa1 family membrane protein insertase [Planctomycetota bacterium]